MENTYSRFRFLAIISVALFFYAISIQARGNTTTPMPLITFQQQQVSGTVTDGNGLPIPGVAVTIKGKLLGTVTNTDGQYALPVGSDAILIFSYLGFEPREEPVGGRREINIRLEEDITSLEEVQINAGYYHTTKRESTGNISRVTAAEIELQPVVSPLQALQGRMAGVSIVQKTGIPGAAPQIQIRGQNSLRTSFEDNGNLPLYIIDGVPIDSGPIHSFSGMTSSTLTGLDPLSTINFSSIESIEVLKDADATAIYGSRGANGVILITTKGGGDFGQETKVTARFSSGVNEVPYFLNLLNTQDYLTLREEAFANDEATPTPNNAMDLLLWDQDHHTDWQETLLGGTAETTNANLSFSGGNNNTTFYLSGGYFKTGTVFPGDFGYEKLSSGLSLSHRNKNERFIAQFSANYGVDVNNQFNSADFVSLALSLSPNAPELYNEDGSLNWENSTWTNPMGATLNTSSAKIQQLNSSLGLSYRITDWLQFTTNAGYTMLGSDELVRNPVEAFDSVVWDRAMARSSHSFTDRSSWILEPQLNFETHFGQWKLDALLGTTFQERTSKNFRISGSGYSSEHLVGNLASANAVNVSNNRDIKYKYNAVFARLGVNLMDRYLLNLTGRRDGSSRFAPQNRFANFGAIGAAWIFSAEKGIQETIPWVSFGKLRGSYGITGNDQIPDYGYLDTYSPTPAPGGLHPTQLVNPNYTWESNKKLEAAIELGFLEDRIHFQLSWYRNRSSNQLIGYTLPAITGFSQVQANLPATVQNTGLEIEGSLINVKSRDWRWETSFNVTFPKTRLVAFPGIEETSYANLLRLGHPLSISLLYPYKGIDSETGLHQVEDVNQDGVLNFEDRVVITDLSRQYYGGFQNQINYKKLSLSFLFQFVGQDGPKSYRVAPGSFSNVLQEDFDNRWQNPGDINVTQKSSQTIQANRAYTNARNSEFLITDASFIRLNNLALSYYLPFDIKTLRSSRIILQGQNLFTITKYKGLDAQVPGSRMLPALRTLTAGIELNF